MPKFAANISMLFTELPFLDRIDAAKAAGFAAVEFQSPYAVPASELAARLEHSGLPAVLFNAPMGDAAASERGLAAQLGRERDFDASARWARNGAAAKPATGGRRRSRV